MTQVSKINTKNDNNLNAEKGLDYEKKLGIANALAEQGLPRAFSPINFVNRIAESYGISINDARECLKEAIKQLETAEKTQNQKAEKSDEKLYAQSGYFYPQAQSKVENQEKDGMDSLIAFGSFQKLKFGL